MPKRLPPGIKKLSNPYLEWINLERNTEKEVAFLRPYGFHAVDLNEVLPPLQRCKLVVRDGYVFMILLFPVFDAKTRIVSTVELDFFITRDRLVTVNAGKLPAVNQALRDFEAKSKTNPKTELAHVLHDLLDSLLESLFPMLVHLSTDIDEVEKSLFGADQRGVIMELLRIKTNIVNVRKAMQGHKKIIRALMAQGSDVMPIYRMQDYYDQLVDFTKEIWDTLEVQRDTINALHETHTSLMENRTNEIMKTLTVFMGIIYPLSLIAALFSMRVSGMPWQDDSYGFLKALAIVGVVGIATVLVFKKRRWI